LHRLLIILTLLITAALNLSAQELSPKHVQKVNRVTSVSKKLKLYRKYFHKDSIKFAKKADQYWKAQSDSLSDAIHDREQMISGKKKSIQDKVNSKIYRTVYKPWAARQAKLQLKWLDDHDVVVVSKTRPMLFNYWENYFLSATQNDSVLTALKAHMPSLRMPKQLTEKTRRYQLKNPLKVDRIQSLARGKLNGLKGVKEANALQSKAGKYRAYAAKYGQYSKVLANKDTLGGFAKAEGEKMAMNYLSKTKEFSQVGQLKGYQDEMKKMGGMGDEYKGSMKNAQDTAYVKEQAKKKAEKLAMDYVAEHPEVMQGVQKKMGLLMKKYSVVQNSNDLSSAIKRSSLKGKTFKERLVFAGNFQIMSFEPFTIDLSPSLGYKINRNFVVGLGGNYRQTFSLDTIPKLSPSVIGYKGFVSYEVLKSFFAYGEFDRNSPGLRRLETQGPREWKNAAFVGIGRRFSVHKKIEMTVLMMYNILHKNNDPIYPRPFVVKVGFQTSELAMLKKK
jgi:hypothetical protein